jgi:predicted aspartyl protease
MKNWNAHKGLAALGLMFLIYAQGAMVVRAEDTVRLRLLGGRLPVVPVRIDDQGPFDFLIDTGTNSTLVTPELAARLRLRPADRVTLITVAGECDVPRARLRRVEVGGNISTDVEALVSGLQQLRRLDPRVSGVLGQNFLEQFNYTLDYDGRAINFEGGGGVPPEGERVPFALEEGKLIVSAFPGPPVARTWRLVLDAAADGLVIFDDPPGALALALRAQGASLLLTEAGSGETRSARLRSLQVGGSRLEDVPVALLHGVAGRAARGEDGLLPTSLFRAIYFNHTGGYVIFNPKRGRAGRGCRR